MAVDIKFISGMAFASLKSVIGKANLIILILDSIRGCMVDAVLFAFPRLSSGEPNSTLEDFHAMRSSVWDLLP
jgi:hypothetical protein